MKFFKVTLLICSFFSCSHIVAQTASNGLTKVGSGSTADFRLGGTLTQATAIDMGTTFTFKFSKNTSNYFFVDNSGNIGIGTASPSAQLHATGSVRFQGLSTNNTLTKIVVTDANGNLGLRDASSLGGGASGLSYDGNGNLTNGGTGNFSALTTGANNVPIANNALQNLTTGRRNVLIGLNNAPKLTTASDHIVIGSNNFRNVTTNGLTNPGIAIGNNIGGWTNRANSGIGSNSIGSSLDSITAATGLIYDNWSIGDYNLQALRSGYDNMVFSYKGLQELDSGNRNNVLGHFGLTYLTMGSQNQAMGFNAGFGVVRGSQNILLGDYAAKGNDATVNNSIFIGSDTRWTGTTNLNNVIIIGDSAVVGNQNDIAVIGKSGTKLAIARTTAIESIHTDGAIVLGSAVGTTDGTIEWNGTDFRGRKSGGWVSLTGGAAGTNSWTQTGSDIYNNTSGNVGIGTSNTQGYKLAVNGDAIFTKVKVKQYSTWPDYVFGNNHKLPSLYELEKFIQHNKHLPDVPSAKEVEKSGLDLSDNQALLLKKIEELTLYIIDINKKLDRLADENSDLKKKLEAKNR